MRECRFECESVDNAAARAVTALSQGPPGSHEHSSPRAGEAGCGTVATVGTSAAGRLQRKELEGCAGTAAQHARDWGAGAGMWPLWRRVGGGCERLRRCGERTGAGMLRPLLHCCEWEVVVGAAALGSRKVCAAGCAVQEGLQAVRKVRSGAATAEERAAVLRCCGAAAPWIRSPPRAERGCGQALGFRHTARRRLRRAVCEGEREGAGRRRELGAMERRTLRTASPLLPHRRRAVR